MPPTQRLHLLFASAVLACGPFKQELRSVPPTPHVLDAQQVGFSTMLVVRDLAASERFYVHHLGFVVTERLDALLRLERPGAALYVVLNSEPTADKPGVTLAPLPSREHPPVNLVFRVKDVRSVHAALAASGLKFLTPPAQPAWGGWRCFAQDPDGYLIEFEQPEP